MHNISLKDRKKVRVLTHVEKEKAVNKITMNPLQFSMEETGQVVADFNQIQNRSGFEHM